jgi:hypothetical protein
MQRDDGSVCRYSNSLMLALDAHMVGVGVSVFLFTPRHFCMLAGKTRVGTALVFYPSKYSF